MKDWQYVDNINDNQKLISIAHLRFLVAIFEREMKRKPKSLKELLSFFNLKDEQFISYDN
jgi:hypothetical protein